MTTPHLVDYILGEQLFPDQPFVFRNHGLAPKLPDCRQCQFNKDPTFRCSVHHRFCGVFQKQFRTQGCWVKHKRRNKSDPTLFQATQQPLEELQSFSEILSKQNQCFELMNYL